MKSFTENMNIALIHDWITNIAGAERVVLELSKLFPEAPIFTSVFDSNKAAIFKDKDVRTSFLQGFPLIKSKREVLIPFTPFAFEQFDLSKYDLVISSSTMASKGVLTKPDTKHICYCHTPPRYLWDPDLDSRAKRGYFSTLRQNTMHKMRIWDRLAADRVDYFIANSNYVAARIKKYYQRESVVIYPPVDVDSFTIDDSVDDYFLFVSRLVNYKRCDLVIDAFNDLGLPLVVIGRGPEKKRLVSKAKSNIKFLGYLSDEELKKYYRRAKAFIFAAEEDFGIVPVEAMASGRPVIAYSKGGVAETVIPGLSGYLFPEQTAQCLIDAVKNFKEEQYDSVKIKSSVNKFSNKRFHKEFMQEVERIINKK